jgi:hypothetical protein
MTIPKGPHDRDLFPDTEHLSYGMGWVLQDHRGHHLVSHAGAIDGFKTHLALVPRAKLGIAVLSNLHHSRMNLALSDTLLDLLLGMPPRDWNSIITRAMQRVEAEADGHGRALLAKIRPGTRPSHGLAAYAGSYENAAYGTVRVVLERGGLVWRWNNFSAPLEHLHDDTFILPIEIVSMPEVVFTLDAGGKVSRMKVLGRMNVEFRRTGLRKEAGPRK